MNEQQDNRQNDGNRNNNQNNNKNGNTILMMVTAAIATLLLITLISSFVSTGNKDYVEYSEFIRLLEEEKVEKVQLNESSLQIVFTLKEEEAQQGTIAYYMLTSPTYYTNMSSFDIQLISRLEAANLESFDVKNSDTNSMLLSILVSYVLPIALVWIFMGVMMRKAGGSGGVMGVVKSIAKRFDMQ